MSSKISLALICGGKSKEHEVSLLSCRSVYENIDKTKYQICIFGITKKGEWYYFRNENFINSETLASSVSLNIKHGIPLKFDFYAKKFLAGGEILNIDLAFPLTHGTFGEDGCLQGLLEIFEIPYVGSKVLGSALGMDKDVMKQVCRINKIKVANSVTVNQNQEFFEIIAKLDTFNWPLFVKPARSGSSVGVSKVKNQDDLKFAIQEAFKHDTKILIEEFIAGIEIECAVLGNQNPIASLPGSVIPTHDFYSYEAKYLDNLGAKFEIPVKLEQEKIEEIQKVSIQVFEILNCSGLARVDFFLKTDGSLIVNEINTLPGFTVISMYSKLWEVSGINYAELLNKLITLALEN